MDALAHPYLDEGRLRYHSCMCKCCYTTASGMRQYTSELETTAPQPFDDHWEKKLTSVQQVKGGYFPFDDPLLVVNCILFLIFRGDAQVHSGATEHKQSSVVHQSAIGCIQEFRQVRWIAIAAEPAQRHCIGDRTLTFWCTLLYI